MPRIKWTRAKEEKLVLMYSSHTTMKMITRTFGLSPAGIYRNLHRLGVDTSPKTITRLDRITICLSLQERKELDLLCRKVGLSRSALIRNLIQKDLQDELSKTDSAGRER